MMHSPRCRPLPANLMPWGTTRRKWRKVSRKKNPRTRRHLHPGDPDQSHCRWRGRYVADFDGRQTTVKVGPFARSGKNRVQVDVADHMETVEAHIKRLPDLGEWFVDIVPSWLAIRDT